MNITIQPSSLKGRVDAPASKSSMQRACAAALLMKGSSIIRNPGHCNDDLAAMDIIRRLGADIEMKEGDLHVQSRGVLPASPEIDCGESGLSIRMFTPIAALSDQPIRISGSGSLMARPLDFFDEVLPLLGVKIHSNDGKLPLDIQGPLRPVSLEVDGSLSSQFLTGLLMAYAASPLLFAGQEGKPGPVIISVRALKSRPYVDLTLEIMKAFGLPVPENRNYEAFEFHPGTHAPIRPVEYTVESDWSGGAFLLVAGAIAGPLTVRGLDLSSRQADKAIIDALMAANAGMAMDAKGIRMHPSAMNAFTFDATDCPDLFPPLVALAAYCNGTSRIMGAGRLLHKESNRAHSLQLEFGKMGVPVEVHGDHMLVKGGGVLQGAHVHSHHDHRIAMACAVAALKAEGETVIGEADAVNKSYPDFFSDLEKAGASLHPRFRLFDV